VEENYDDYRLVDFELLIKNLTVHYNSRLNHKASAQWSADEAPSGREHVGPEGGTRDRPTPVRLPA
jgi:hypothetical protein